eukprot:jgi/Galph1/3012/GphlegSOOS_G1676.1
MTSNVATALGNLQSPVDLEYSQQNFTPQASVLELASAQRTLETPPTNSNVEENKNVPKGQVPDQEKEEEIVVLNNGSSEVRDEQTTETIDSVDKEHASERTISSDSRSAEQEQKPFEQNQTKPVVVEQTRPVVGLQDIGLEKGQKVFGKDNKLQRKMALLAKLNEVESRKLKHMEQKNKASASPVEKPLIVDRASPPTLNIQISGLGEDSEGRTVSSPQGSERDKSARSLRPRTPGSQRNLGKVITSTDSLSNDYKEDPLYYKCKNILRSLMERKDARAFLKPVNELFTSEEIPGYYQIIQHPMDLGTVLYRMELGLYRDPGIQEFSRLPKFDLERFKADVRLVWENAMTYNLENTPYYVAAAKLSETFERKLEATFKNVPEAKGMKSREKKRPKSARPTSERPLKRTNISTFRKKSSSEDTPYRGSSRTTPSVKPTSSSPGVVATTTSTAESGRNKNHCNNKSSYAAASRISMTAESPLSSIQRLEQKIKELERIQSQAPNVEYQSQEMSPASPSPLSNIPMTYEEKRRLGDNINLLPEDKLAKVIQIIMRHKGSAPVNEQEEIVIDIDALDTRTLREMEAFVQSALQKRIQKKRSSPLGETYTTQTSSVTSELETLREQLRSLQGNNYEVAVTMESGQTASATSGKGYAGSKDNELNPIPENTGGSGNNQQQKEEQMYSSDDSDSTSETASLSDN